jgi:hypothetical protein
MQMSDALQLWLRREIESQPADSSPGNWPRQVMKENNALLIHGDALTLWFLGLDGTLYWLDTDRVSRRLEPEHNPKVIREVLEVAVTTFPKLAELLH